MTFAYLMRDLVALKTIVTMPVAFVRRRDVRSSFIADSRRVAGDRSDTYCRTEWVSVVYHGVDLVRFSPDLRSKHRAPMRRSLGIPEHALVALYVGELRKGGRTAIDAITTAPDWHLLTVSRPAPGPYTEYARERGVGDRVVLASPPDVVEQMYAASDAFVVPNAYDAFGMVGTKATASGMPVIVSVAAGASEVVEHEQCGFLLDSAENSAEVGKHLAARSRDRASLARMGEAAHRAEQPYTWGAIAEQTMAVYERAEGRRTR